MSTEAVQENVAGFGVVLGATHPERLIEWYRAALEPLGARWEGHMLAVGASIIGFDGRDDVAEKAAEPGRHLINVLVRDLRAAEQHLDSLGVTWVRPVEEMGDGWLICTVADPVGNYLQFLQSSQAD
ncbi:VOC family protein [Streptomyces sulphureus]|uniref:VOC family protein n=1 Tax=Streptomyces sulphureus TaxID=47758 RepID=UPI000382A2F4|nr:VOC family protein [Streptomyces sulphureus]